MTSPNGDPFLAIYMNDQLAAGIEGKKILWRNLGDFAGLRERLPDVDFDRLIERAAEQRAELEPFRAEAGRRALAATDAVSR